ncbi:MAG: hypothetical protein JW726_06725 [Anaerolineales bacterium]|nr:hypothetical protein [Anaerolineales bacterium]
MTASFTLGVQRAWAADGDGEEGEIVRQISIVMSYERYEWWLLRWADSQIVCRAFIDHDNWPTADDILLDCGQTVYTEWANTDVCLGATDGSGDTSTCTGLYLFYIGSQMDEKTIVVDLPPPQVYVSLGGCEPTSPENLCPSLPVLVFNAEEPLPNEQVTAIHVVMNDQTYTCEGDVCEVPMQATPLNGTTLEFWSESSFGDESDHFTALVRVVDSGVMLSPAGTGWYVDVLSSQWRGNQVASCAQVWQAFPPVGGPSEWLQTPEAPELLATVEPYSYLAGRLIAQGLVDASGCPGGGLLLNGYADACGTEAAMPVVEQWQNQFDIQILDVAQATGVPAQLMKNIFAQESQFWPGMFRIPYEFGLGQMTDNGAETILLWNPTFYEQFCPLVLDASVCQKGYIYLDSESQAILRGALALESKADCQGCEAGIDLTDIDFSINLFAQTLLANCEQMAQIMYNATGKIAGEVSGYEDLWRFTVANYHVGPGCTSYAMYKAWAARVPMDWAHVASYLTEPCSSAIPYVDSISGIP